MFVVPDLPRLLTYSATFVVGYSPAARHLSRAAL
jgi:hypothetical protein